MKLLIPPFHTIHHSTRSVTSPCVPPRWRCARLQRKLIALGVIGMVCRIASRVESTSYPESMLPPMLNAVRAERLEALTLQLRESIRRSCSAALGNLSYIRYGPADSLTDSPVVTRRWLVISHYHVMGMLFHTLRPVVPFCAHHPASCMWSSCTAKVSRR